MNSDFKARGARGEIWLYDPVGSNFMGDGISAKIFQRELTALGPVSSIHLRINSPGGDVFDGFSIYNQLRAHPAKVNVDIDGVAASISSIIAMAGDTVNVAQNAMIMIHDPQGMSYGNADEMRRTAALLDQVKGNLAQTYVDRTGSRIDQIEQWMSDESWFTADEAVQYGFADAVTNPSRVTACFDPSMFRHVPEALRKRMASAIPTPMLDRHRASLRDNERRVAAIFRGIPA